MLAEPHENWGYDSSHVGGTSYIDQGSQMLPLDMNSIRKAALFVVCRFKVFTESVRQQPFLLGYSHIAGSLTEPALGHSSLSDQLLLAGEM